MPGMNGTSSGFFLSQAKRKRYRGRMGKTTVYIWKKKSFNTLMYKWAKEINEKVTPEEI